MCCNLSERGATAATPQQSSCFQPLNHGPRTTDHAPRSEAPTSNTRSGNSGYGSNPARLHSRTARRNSALISLTRATWARLLRPCFQCAATTLALPAAVFGPVLLPPCSLQRFRPLMAGFWHGVPRRVLARQRLPGQLGPKRVAWLASISAVWLV